MSDEPRLRRLYEGALARQPMSPDTAPTLEELEALAAGRMDDDAALALLDRVMSDPRLRGEYELLRATHGAGRRLRPAGIPRWVALAAAATLIVGGALTWRALSPGVDPVVRSGAAVALAAPGDAAEVAAPVELSWRPTANRLRYQVHVIDDRETDVLSTTTQDTALAIPADRLRAGAVYRWWVEATTDAGAVLRSEVRRFSVGPSGAVAPR